MSFGIRLKLLVMVFWYGEDYIHIRVNGFMQLHDRCSTTFLSVGGNFYLLYFCFLGRQHKQRRIYILLESLHKKGKQK